MLHDGPVGGDDHDGAGGTILGGEAGAVASVGEDNDVAGVGRVHGCLGCDGSGMGEVADEDAGAGYKTCAYLQLILVSDSDTCVARVGWPSVSHVTLIISRALRLR